MKSTPALLLLLIFALNVRAAEPAPLLTTTGKTIVSEDFAGPEMPKTFHTLESAASFSLADGALQAIARAGQERSTHGAFPSIAHDLTVSFMVKFAAPAALYIGVDGYKEEFKGNTHLVRFSVTPEQIGWDQKRGGPDSKHAISEANRAARAAKQPILKATAEQLADPSFFRTESLTSKPVHAAIGEWHHVLLEVSGNDLVAQVDGDVLWATSTVADSKKSRIGVGVTGRGAVLIDNLRISENTRRADWEKVKARYAAPAAPASK